MDKLFAVVEAMNIKDFTKEAFDAVLQVVVDSEYHGRARIKK